MSKNAKSALASLAALATHVCRRKATMRFIVTESLDASLAGIISLADEGLPMKVYSGNVVYTFNGSEWSLRNTSKTREHVAVDVGLGHLY